jgi:putative ABC transport system permease protein
MPKGFQFPPGEQDPPELWVPLQLDPANPGGRGSHYLSLMGRLKDGVPLRQAQDELARLVRQYGEQDGPNRHSLHPKNHPLVSYSFKDEVIGGVRLAMLVLMGAVAFVLLIACVNVANLLLARAESRQREIAVRTAMGATLGRLVRQFVTEGVMLSLTGALLGAVLAYGGVRLITASNAGSIPRAQEIGVDARVLLFTLLVSVGTGLFFGLSPVAHMRMSHLAEALKASSSRNTSGGGSQSFRRALVIAELSLALVLLIGSGLMVKAFWKLQQVDAGIQPRGILTMSVTLTPAVYTTPQSAISFWSRLQPRLSAIPGVESASFVTGLPPSRRLDANDTQIEGFVMQKNGPIQNVDFWQTVGKRYFETMEIRLIDGRLFDDRDGRDAPQVVIVNQTMARHFWGNESPIGKRVRPGFRDPWRTVVGVAADVKNAGIDKPTGTELYFPYEQDKYGLNNASVLLRTKGDPRTLTSAARSAIAGLDPGLPVSSVRTMDDVLSAAQARPRFLTMLLTLFSTVALALAAVGIYGVISFSVAQRTNEIGIRMAIGAGQSDVLRLVLAQGLRLGVIGVLCGVVGALALTRLISGLLFGVSWFDPGTFVVMALVLAAVTLLACYIPARRATKVDPMVALRYE